VLTDICALADHFLMALTNINSREVGDDGHLVRLASCTHTPTWHAIIDES